MEGVIVWSTEVTPNPQGLFKMKRGKQSYPSTNKTTLFPYGGANEISDLCWTLSETLIPKPPWGWEAPHDTV